MKAKITPDNIKGFVQGWTRKIFSFAIDKHILEQVEYRALKAKECVEQGFCSVCGCSFPEKLYENRGCHKEENACYGPMLNAEQWEKFKTFIDDKAQTDT